jgi:hypothetical protein
MTMKLMLLLLVASFVTLQQAEGEEPDLQVVKFSWAREKQPRSSMIRGAHVDTDFYSSWSSEGL